VAEEFFLDGVAYADVEEPTQVFQNVSSGESYFVEVDDAAGVKDAEGFCKVLHIGA
jgi:hypothetical protein